MEIIKKITKLEKSIEETENLVKELISNLNTQKIKVANKEKKILYLKREVRTNVEKIDKIIENYNVNS